MSRSRPKLAAVILAAGYSARMGQFKPRLPLGSRSAVEHAIAAFQGAGIADIIIITGHRGRELASVLEQPGVKCVFNPNYASGMYSSIVVGIDALSVEIEAVFILPVDIPLVRPSTIAKLAAAYDAGRAPVTYPVFRHRRGHPPLIDRTVFAHIVSSNASDGLRGVLRPFESQSATISVLDQAIHLDMDTPADYARMNELALSREVLTESECEALLAELEVPEHVVRHSRVVAEAAQKLAICLVKHGEDLNLALIRAGSLLHDLAKGKPDHAQAGAAMLDALGYPRIAQIIASHTNLQFCENVLDEAAVVYLADKLVRGEKLVTLRQRFERSFQVYCDDAAMMPLIERQWETALQVAATVERRCGMCLAEIFGMSAGDLAAPVAQHEEGVLLGTTESVCPQCLARIDAHRIAENGNVYLVKNCPEHGRFKTITWRGEPAYHSWALASKRSHSPPASTTAESLGCPFDCGLCQDHRQHTCCVLLEVTERCNLACPFCFASSPSTQADPGVDDIENWLRMLLASGGPFNLQLSGGEPTLRDDLPEIIARARGMGFSFIQLNTNGLRLAQDVAYLERLKTSGLDCVFLQFDGVTDAVYEQIRGRALFSMKLEVIQRCRDQQLGVVLVPTLVPGVNTGQIGDIIRWAIEEMPTVRAVHFQPVSYFGRYPATPSDADRITLPEVMREIERQTDGMIRMPDFHPPAAENAYCSFQGKFTLCSDGKLTPSCNPGQTSCCSPVSSQSGLVQLESPSLDSRDESKRAREFVARQWVFPVSEPSLSGRDSPSHIESLDAFLRDLQLNTLTISGMAFQDAWNLDLERLRDCFIHVVSPDRRLVPLCAYNLTDARGRALYRRRHSQHLARQVVHA